MVPLTWSCVRRSVAELRNKRHGWDADQADTSVLWPKVTVTENPHDRKKDDEPQLGEVDLEGYGDR